MCITEDYLFQEKSLKVFEKYKQNMMGYAKDVRKERIQRRHFQVVKAKQKESWKSSTPMYVVLCHEAHYEGMHIMFLLLMTFLGRHGFTS